MLTLGLICFFLLIVFVLLFALNLVEFIKAAFAFWFFYLRSDKTLRTICMRFVSYLFGTAMSLTCLGVLLYKLIKL